MSTKSMRRLALVDVAPAQHIVIAAQFNLARILL
jgi:hypothetical protein